MVKAAAHISGDGVKPFLLHSFLFVWFVQLSKGQAGLEVCFAKDWKAPGACISLLTLASPSWCLHSPLLLASHPWCLQLTPGACILFLVPASHSWCCVLPLLWKAPSSSAAESCPNPLSPDT